MTTRRRQIKNKPFPYSLVLIVTGISFALGVLVWQLHPQSLGINEVGYATGGVTLSLYPAVVNLYPNTETTLTLEADAGNVRVTYIKVELTYDPAKLATPVVTKGDFLTGVIADPVVENGKITFEFNSPPAGKGKAGSGTLATIKVKPTVVGRSNLFFTPTTVATALDSAGNEITGNFLKSASDAVINTGTDNETSANPPSTLDNPENQPSLNQPGQPLAQSTKQTPDEPFFQSPDQADFLAISDDSSSPPTNRSTYPNLFQQAYLGWQIILAYVTNVL